MERKEEGEEKRKDGGVRGEEGEVAIGSRERDRKKRQRSFTRNVIFKKKDVQVNWKCVDLNKPPSPLLCVLQYP